MKQKTKLYIFFIILTLAVGGLSAFLTRNNMNIYETVNKPSFAPPAFVFPVAWSILYILMGIGMARTVISGEEKGKNILPSLTFYVLQLIVNFFWSIIFFNMQNFLLALIWLLLLLVLAAAMTVKFGSVDKISALLQIPYLLWLVFAALLNYFIFYNNL